MNLLLDTNAFIWFRLGHRRLGTRARAAIERGAVQVRVSVATAWELAIKTSGAQFELPEPLDTWFPRAIEESGFELLPIALDHAVGVASLPVYHRDPFDRLLIAQARTERLTLVTADAAFDRYDVPLLDARR